MKKATRAKTNARRREKKFVKTRNDENKSNEGKKIWQKNHYLLGKKRKKRMVIIRVRNNGHCNYILYTLLRSIALLWIHLKLIRQMITWCIYIQKLWICFAGLMCSSNWPTNNLSSIWCDWKLMKFHGAKHLRCTSQIHVLSLRFLHSFAHSMQQPYFLTVHLTVAHIVRLCCAVLVTWLEYKWNCREQKKWASPSFIYSGEIFSSSSSVHFNRIVINAKSSNLQTNQQREKKRARARGTKTGPTSFAAFFCRCVHLNIQNLP